MNEDFHSSCVVSCNISLHSNKTVLNRATLLKRSSFTNILQVFLYSALWGMEFQLLLLHHRQKRVKNNSMA